MALATYTIPAPAVTFASGKSMLGVFNGSGSGVVIKIWRIWILNNQTAGVTGVITTFELRKSTAQSSGTTATPEKHDTNNANWNASVLTAYGATVTDGNLMRKILWTNDEPAASTATNDEWECVVPLNCVWDAGYADTNVQPWTLRETQGMHVKHSGTSAVGNCDVYMEATQE